MTSCETCRRHELTTIERIREDLRAAIKLFIPRRTSAADILQGFPSLTRAAMGRETLTHYDRHKIAYERDGDPLELTRMLRHVK